MIFDSDIWKEIYQTLSRNKLRTILTAFGVSWGILMLVVMLAGSNGLRNGVSKNFSGMVSNSVFMWSGMTSLPYKGMPARRPVQFKNSDITYLQQNLEGLDLISPGLQLGGWNGDLNVSHNDKIGQFEINGYFPSAKEIKLLKIPEGRFISEGDIQEFRKVCVLGKSVRDILFDPEEEFIGQFININGIYFKVIGQFKSARNDADNDEDRSIYIPFSTFQKVYNMGDMVHWVVITGKEGYHGTDLEKNAKDLLKKKHIIHPDDPRAFGSWNLQKEIDQMNGVFFGIEMLTWVVGIFTLLAGVIGISNIMLVIVKEKTKEIGIRRAIGATPFKIISQIFLESLLLTFFAGSFGLMSGIGLIYFAETVDTEYFSNPTVPFEIAILALVILILAGMFAGILPSYRAIQIKPIEAIRTE